MDVFLAVLCQVEILLLAEAQLPVGIANKMGCTEFQQQKGEHALAVPDRLKTLLLWMMS